MLFYGAMAQNNVNMLWQGRQALPTKYSFHYLVPTPLVMTGRDNYSSSEHITLWMERIIPLQQKLCLSGKKLDSMEQES